MCLVCVYSPCACDLVKLDERIKFLSCGKEGKEEAKEGKKEMQEDEEDEEERKEGGLLGGARRPRAY